MKFYFILLPFIFIFNIANCQCNCKGQFLSIKRDVEKNYPGFFLKTAGAYHNPYTSFTDSILTASSKQMKQSYCLMLLKNWLGFFKDYHMQLGPSKASQFSKLDTLKITEFASHQEKINLSSLDISRLSSLDTGVEGIYLNLMDSTYTVAIVKAPNSFRDYAAVIIKSKSTLWHAGEIKFEMRKPDSSKICETLFYDLFHNYSLKWFTFGDQWLDGQAWVKFGYIPDWFNKEKNNKPDHTKDYPSYEIKRLSTNTCYLKIPSFRLTVKKNIDSAIIVGSSILLSSNNLILDLRGNTGGGDNAFSSLIPYICTGLITTIGTDFYATPDNIRRKALFYSHSSYDTSNKIINNEKNIELKNYFVCQTKDYTTNYKSYELPKRVIILIDKGCASATEQFLLLARQSNKVILMGQTTQGTLDYSNLLESDSICHQLSFSYPSTRSRRIDRGEGIDNIGISPKIEILSDQDWVQIALKYLKD